MSDAPSSVQHGHLQTGSVQRKEVTGEFPAFLAVLNHLYKTYLSPRELGESSGDMESCISHCQFLPLDSLQPLCVQPEIAAGKPWKTQLLRCLAAHPGAWRTPRQTRNETYFSLGMRSQETKLRPPQGSMAGVSLDSLQQRTAALPGCSAVGSTGRSCRDSHQTLSRYFEY